MSRFETKFALNDVSMTIDTIAEENATDEEKSIAVKNAIISRLFTYTDAKNISDEERDKLIDIKSLSEIEKKSYTVEGYRNMFVTMNIDAYDEENATEIAEDVIYDDYSNLIESSEVDSTSIDYVSLN